MSKIFRHINRYTKSKKNKINLIKTKINQTILQKRNGISFE